MLITQLTQVDIDRFDVHRLHGFPEAAIGELRRSLDTIFQFYTFDLSAEHVQDKVGNLFPVVGRLTNCLHHSSGTTTRVPRRARCEASVGVSLSCCAPVLRRDQTQQSPRSMHQGAAGFRVGQLIAPVTHRNRIPAVRREAP